MPITERVPGLTLLSWWLWKREVVQVRSDDPRDVAAFEEELERLGQRVLDRTVAGTSHIFMLDKQGLEEESVWSFAYAHDCLQAPPSVLRGGWGDYRCVALEEDGVRQVLGILAKSGRAELVTKRELPLQFLPPTMWIQGIFAELTARQLRALLAAQEAGYYESPRRTRASDIARSAGLERTTFEEHLRKAENRILSGLMGYTRIYANLAPAPPPGNGSDVGLDPWAGAGSAPHRERGRAWARERHGRQ